ncbi:hypothetical protein OHA77_22860 [Streptosporangium sp. NBC_01639]|uniref:hypothetical protein n=1 Tax=Streptosporangium sp. NBC_01639 TaxID=2975948 RepID=UPI00386A9EEE|nr:hypothetical protein OHA77_22860 [Streptosporangium sp. NBC_01639]
MPFLSGSFGAGARADSGPSASWARPIGNGADRNGADRGADDSSASTEASFRVLPAPTPAPTPTNRWPIWFGDINAGVGDDLLDDIEAGVETKIGDIEAGAEAGVGAGLGDTEPADPGSGHPRPKHHGPGNADSEDSDPVDFGSDFEGSEPVDFGNIGPGPVGPAPTGDASLPFTGIDGRRLAVQALAGAGAVLVGACLILLSTSRRRHRKKG